MKEYLGAKEKTQKTIIDGWIYSGDLYKLNENGKTVSIFDNKIISNIIRSI